MPEFVLASSSPRRRELLASIGVVPTIWPADVDETPVPGESAAAMVERLARAKVETALRDGAIGHEAVVIGGDVTVLVDGEILAKPIDDDDARRMLVLLSGRRHHVVGGVAVGAAGSVVAAVETTGVTMRPLAAADIEWYLGTREHVGKAGAYGIQGAAAAFVSGIDGDYSNIVGLPLATLDRLVASLGYSLRASGEPPA